MQQFIGFSMIHWSILKRSSYDIDSILFRKFFVMQERFVTQTMCELILKKAIFGPDLFCPPAYSLMYVIDKTAVLCSKYAGNRRKHKCQENLVKIKAVLSHR